MRLSLERSGRPPRNDLKISVGLINLTVCMQILPAAADGHVIIVWSTFVVGFEKVGILLDNGDHIGEMGLGGG